MRINIGNTDRIVRIVFGVLLILFTMTGAIGPWGWLGLVPLATGILRRCPAYGVLRVSTCRSEPSS